MGISKSNRWMWLRHKLFILSAGQLVWTLIVLQLLDCATTLFLIAHTSVDLESNPIVRLMLEAPGGMWWLVAAKLTVCGLIGWVVPWSLRHSPRMSWVWRALAIIYLAIVMGNLWGVAIVCMLF